MESLMFDYESNIVYIPLVVNYEFAGKRHTGIADVEVNVIKSLYDENLEWHIIFVKFDNGDIQDFWFSDSMGCFTKLTPE